MSQPPKRFSVERSRASQGRLPHKITLDGYPASHRAAREILKEHHGGKRTTIQSGIMAQLPQAI
jgi:hypothetical protein